ncbi:MAG: hypothetical protein PHO99_05020 [Candidatus Methanomethylophilaceae archaeon]|nr:hypothetical protein [Candidatus Methanomethylophilaceae archaeon]
MFISDWIYGAFGPYGDIGMLLCVFLIFLIDAFIFPTLPELFFVIGFIYQPTLAFGLQLLAAAVIAEVIGFTTLYWVVEHIRVPQRIKNIADKYIKFLIVNDERIFLINRIAPMIPFAGAFISLIDEWKFSKAMFYIVIGCILKYGMIMLMSNFFFEYFSSDDATLYTLLFVFIIIIASFIATYIKKKRSGMIDD